MVVMINQQKSNVMGATAEERQRGPSRTKGSWDTGLGAVGTSPW